ncbi:MAG: DNA cytosine methyltransferase [Desulfurellales bacterium]|nr:MAG: DNA cytosine methyltransferase [Desulfurellales bacterium]
MNELALFSGAGGGILGGKLLVWRCVCAVEIDDYARDALISRQDDGCIEPFPIWDDIRTFDGKPWRGVVDIVTGGFPCQDISSAGRGAGITGERSGLWKEMARIIGEVRPRFALVENSPVLTSRGLGVVLGDLAEMGYDARWGVPGAHHAGAPHKRDRIWIVADAEGAGSRGIGGRIEKRFSRSWSGCENASSMADALRFRGAAGIPEPEQRQEGATVKPFDCRARRPVASGWWSTEPQLGRVANGVANRVDRLRCIGNGQVPAVVKLAWDTLHTERLMSRPLVSTSGCTTNFGSMGIPMDLPAAAMPGNQAA